MFKEQQDWQHRMEARQLVNRLGVWLALLAVAGLYLAAGRALGIYDWRLGIAATATIILAAAASLQIIARWHKLRLAPTCPVCGGLFEATEQTLRASSLDGVDNLPAIIDRVSTCQSCGRKHHHVFAASGESGSLLPITLQDSFGSMYTRKAVLWRQHPGKSEQEIDQMVAELEAHQQSKVGITRAEWQQLLKSLQQQAEMQNREQGMELPSRRR